MTQISSLLLVLLKLSMIWKKEVENGLNLLFIFNKNCLIADHWYSIITVFIISYDFFCPCPFSSGFAPTLLKESQIFVSLIRGKSYHSPWHILQMLHYIEIYNEVKCLGKRHLRLVHYLCYKKILVATMFIGKATK